MRNYFVISANSMIWVEAGCLDYVEKCYQFAYKEFVLKYLMLKFEKRTKIHTGFSFKICGPAAYIYRVESWPVCDYHFVVPRVI